MNVPLIESPAMSPFPPARGETPDQLGALLVALDLKGITLRLEGEQPFARPASALDAETKAMLREMKTGVITVLRLSPDGQRTALLLSFEQVLDATAREIQALADTEGWQSRSVLAYAAGWAKTMQRYEALSKKGDS